MLSGWTELPPRNSCGAITVRVIRVLDWSTYDGWLWLEGYQLNDSGDAMFSRCLYVRCDGIELCSAANGSGSRPPRISGHNQWPVDERKADD